MKLRLLHLAAVIGFAVAQPLYDVLRRNGEFFVAHRVDQLDILLLIFWLSATLPLLLALLLWIVGRVSERAAAALTIGLVGFFVAVVLLPLASRRAGIAGAEVLAVSGAHGVVAAILYARFAGARQFLTLLSPAAVVFPLVFLFQPSMRPFVRPQDPTAGSQMNVTGDAPIVFVIFDQLPLTSLLDATGNIDARAFPAFASLAADAIWFRNATTTADFTVWAVPAIVSGKYPRPGTMPITAYHPHNLFTALASAYRIEAVEPITRLCPQELCPEGIEPRFARQAGMLSDLSVVYARAVLPQEFTAGLPELTDNWRDFVRGQQWQALWGIARTQDRSEPMKRLIDSISATDRQPTLYFAHVLLPHEPFVYLSDGRRFTDDPGMIGLGPNGIWSDDPWYAQQTYRRHLLQVGYVDSLLGALLTRLKRQGLYDRALIVVTSDHGVAFRHGQPMKGFREATLVDIVPVPLIIKPPHHSGPRVSDRNVQTIDILPTVADLLHTRLPFEADGVSAVGSAAPAAEKRLYYIAATKMVHLPPSLWNHVAAGIERKGAIFGTSGPDDAWSPGNAPFNELIDRPVRDLVIGHASTALLELGAAWRFSRVDVHGSFIPARLSGRIHGRAASRAVPLAVAVNGVIRATTKSVGAPLPSAGAWSALVPPDSFRDGMNAVDVYEISGEGAAVVLHPALHSSGHRPDLNLISGEAYNWIVSQDGFYPRQAFGKRSLRWTNGNAQLRLFETPGYRHGSLRLELAPLTRRGTSLTIAVNGCALFDGQLAGGAWDRTFSLSSCPEEAVEPAVVEIQIVSSRATAGRDGRELGVPILDLEFAGR